jgi:hypothetical protein
MAKVKRCKAVNCTEFTYARGFCPKHYARWRRYSRFTPRPVIKAGICLTDNCANKSVGKGLCWKHYRRALRGYYKRAAYACLIFHALPHWLLYLQDHPMPELTFDDLEKPKKVRRIPTPPHPNAKPCSILGCDDYMGCRGVCNKHYQYMQYHGILPPKAVKPANCTAVGCHGKRYAKNLCRMHYARLYRHGTVDLAEQRTATIVHFGPEAMLNQVTV